MFLDCYKSGKRSKPTKGYAFYRGGAAIRILVALIAVFIMSDALANYRTETTIGREDRKDICTAGDVSDVFGKKGRPIYTCQDPRTANKEKVHCKNSPKQKLPPKITLAELDKACGL